MQIAKISRPIISRVLPRQRLFKLIDHSRRKPVLWVSGPPGSGKTSLVCNYLDARRLPCLWYQVDEGDSDIATFFYYMGLAGKKASPKKKPLPVLTREYLPGLAVFTKRYFENLYGRLKTPSVMVFDNYQEVSEESPFHEVIREGLSSIPEGINVIVISRRDTPGTMARMRSGRLIEMLGWDELKLTLQESKKMIQLRHKGLPDQIVEDLHEKTNGWAAGLVLSMESLKAACFDPGFFDVYGREEIFNYFAGEVFDKAQSGMQDFLLKTALFSKFSPVMAESLTGNTQAHDILTDLNRANYFTQRHSYHGLMYQYHPLFRGFLLERGKKVFPSDDLLNIQRTAAAVLEENDQLEDALDLFKIAEDWSHAITLVLRQAPAMVAQGRWQTLETWIKSMPESMVDQNPWLLYWFGMCQIPRNPVKAGEYLENAYTLFADQEDVTGMFFALCATFESIAVSQGSFQKFDSLVSRLGPLYNSYEKSLPVEIKARAVSSMLQAIVFRQPNHRDVEVWFERGLSFAHGSVNAEVNLKVYTLVMQFLYQLFSGELAKAHTLMNQVLGLVRSPGVSPLSLVIIHGMEAYYYWSISEFEQCQNAVAKGLSVSSATGVHVHDTVILAHAAAGALSAGDLKTAQQSLQRLSSLLGARRGYNASLYHHLEAWMALLRKDLHGALLRVESAMELAVEAGMPQTLANRHLGAAVIMHELNRTDEAAGHIAEVRKIADRVKILQIEFGCCLAEARFAFDTGNEETGLVSLAKAMSLGKEQGYTNTFLFWQPDVMAELCLRALEAGIEVEYVRGLIRKRNLVPKSPPLECENWPFAVKIFTLGRFSLLVGEKPVTLPKKAPRKPLAMLKALIALGGRDVSEERLSSVLWPDADGDLAHESFTITLHRLRRLAGNENFIRLHEGRMTLDPRYCWVDIWALERLLNQADAVLSDGDPDRALRLTEKSTALYHGSFLAEDSDSWTIPMQERLRSKFIRSVGKMGVLLEEKSEWDKAVEYYQKGLEAENTAEEFYRHLMICYDKLGRHTDALSVYHRCCKTLSAVLDVRPSPGTEATYNTIRANVPTKE